MPIPSRLERDFALLRQFKKASKAFKTEMAVEIDILERNIQARAQLQANEVDFTQQLASAQQHLAKLLDQAAAEKRQTWGDNYQDDSGKKAA